MILSVSACGCLYTAVSTATRGRVTRRAASRNKCSTSNLVGTVRVWSHSLESVKCRAAVFEVIWNVRMLFIRSWRACGYQFEVFVEVDHGEAVPAIIAGCRACTRP